MRPLHRPKAPTIDYRDRPRRNLRVLGGTLALGIGIGAAAVLLASMTRPQARPEPAAATTVRAGLTSTDAATAKVQPALAPAGAAGERPASAPAGAASAEADLASARAASGQPASAATQASDAVTAYQANELKNALLKQSASLRACYDSYLLDEPDVPDGKVTMDFQIDPDGRVIGPAIVASELESAALSDCLVARVAGFAFPAPPEHRKTYAAHTFVFKRDVR